PVDDTSALSNAVDATTSSLLSEYPNIVEKDGMLPWIHAQYKLTNHTRVEAHTHQRACCSAVTVGVLTVSEPRSAVHTTAASPTLEPLATRDAPATSTTASFVAASCASAATPPNRGVTTVGAPEPAPYAATRAAGVSCVQNVNTDPKSTALSRTMRNDVTV